MANQRGEDLFAIAHLARTHGVRGEVSAIPLTPPVLDPAGLIIEKRLFLRDPQGKLREVEGEAVREHQDRWLVKLVGVDTMTEAEALRGHDLCLPREELPALPENWYYEADLEGCEVIDTRLGPLGTVAGLEVGYVQPQLKVSRPDGRIVLLPWRTALFPEVDLVARKITASLPEGMPGIEDEA
jgi:16S rRNA processing protein RimM